MLSLRAGLQDVELGGDEDKEMNLAGCLKIITLICCQEWKERNPGSGGAMRGTVTAKAVYDEDKAVLKYERD